MNRILALAAGAVLLAAAAQAAPEPSFDSEHAGVINAKLVLSPGAAPKTPAAAPTAGPAAPASTSAPVAFPPGSVVKKVTKADFDAEVIKSSIPVIVDFYADWCPHCRAQAQVVEAFAKFIDPAKAKVVRVDVDTDEALLMKLLPPGTKNYTIPQTWLYRNGSAVKVKFVLVMDAQGNVTGIRVVRDP